MSATLSLKVETRHDELDRITAAVEDFGEQESWSPALIFRVNLVLEELGLNVMDYGYDDGIHEFEIVLTSEPDTLTIEIIDDGRPFDPLSDTPPPVLEGSIEDRPIGGLGVHLVRELMDELHYRREQGRNHLTLATRKME